MSCFDHDPDWPVVLGVLPGSDTAHGAARSRGRDGVYCSDLGQGLSVAGAGVRAPEGTCLTLHGPWMRNALSLSVGEAADADLVRLACERGALSLVSGGDGVERSGARTEEAGGRREVKAASAHLRTDGAAHGRAGGDVSLVAATDDARTGQRARAEAAKRLQVRAGGAGSPLNMRADTHLSLTSTGPTRLRTEAGRGRLTGAGLSLKGAERITITNAARSAGVVVGGGGLTLWGHRVELVGSERVQMDSQERHHEAGGHVAEEPVAVEALEDHPLPTMDIPGRVYLTARDWSVSGEAAGAARCGEPVTAHFTARGVPEAGSEAQVSIHGTTNGEVDDTVLTETTVPLDPDTTEYRTELALPTLEGDEAPEGVVFRVAVEGRQSGVSAVRELQPPIPEVDDQWRQRAIDFIEENKVAYEPGVVEWYDPPLPRTPNGNARYQRSLVAKLDGEYRVVYTLWHTGEDGLSHVYSHLKNHDEPLLDCQVDEKEHERKRETQCNIALNVFAQRAGAGNLYGVEQRDANTMLEAMAKGALGSGGTFELLTDYKRAEAWASRGHFVVVGWRSPTPNQPGHVAVLTGGCKGESALGNLNIYQAGGEVDAMDLAKGFGNIRPEPSQDGGRDYGSTGEETPQSIIEIYLWRPHETTD